MALIFLMLSSGQAYAACTVNGANYNTNSDTSGTYITLENLTSQASSWNNTTDLVTTCDVSQFTSMYEAFKDNSAFNQDLSAWDTSAVTSMHSMFRSATSLTSVTLPKTGNVTDMSVMFRDATSLTSVTLPDTSAVRYMSGMFNGATSLTSVTLPDTSAVMYMTGMFSNATNLTSVTLPKTGAVTSMSYMFFGATSLTSVTLPKTGAVTDMSSMFDSVSFQQLAMTHF